MEICGNVMCFVIFLCNMFYMKMNIQRLYRITSINEANTTQVKMYGKLINLFRVKKRVAGVHTFAIIFKYFYKR